MHAQPHGYGCLCLVCIYTSWYPSQPARLSDAMLLEGKGRRARWWLKRSSALHMWLGWVHGACVPMGAGGRQRWTRCDCELSLICVCAWWAGTWCVREAKQTGSAATHTKSLQGETARQLFLDFRLKN